MTNLLRNNMHESRWAEDIDDSYIEDHVDSARHHELVDEYGNLYEIEVTIPPSTRLEYFLNLPKKQQ